MLVTPDSITRRLITSDVENSKVIVERSADRVTGDGRRRPEEAGASEREAINIAEENPDISIYPYPDRLLSKVNANSKENSSPSLVENEIAD